MNKISCKYHRVQALQENNIPSRYSHNLTSTSEALVLLPRGADRGYEDLAPEKDTMSYV
jgi:hypothetical protein